MTIKQQNIRQLILSSLLVLGIVALSIARFDNGGVDFDKNQFTLDENTIITTVVVEGANFRHQFEYMDGQWVLNNGYSIDDGMRDVFFAVLSQIELQRPVSNTEREEILNLFDSNGLSVSILNAGQMIMKYKITGVEENFETYIMSEEDEVPYLAHIPGYQSYLAGIYEAGELDWRSRYIWDIDWSSLKTMILEYDNQVTRFEYEESFLNVIGTELLDSAAMLDYLQGVAFLQTDKYLKSKEIPEYDEVVSSSNPIITINVEQIGSKKSKLQIFDIPQGKRYHPAVLDEVELVLFNPTVVESLKRPTAFFDKANR